MFVLPKTDLIKVEEKWSSALAMQRDGAAQCWALGGSWGGIMLPWGKGFV